MYQNDNRIVITLDAGGTNFVFGAMRANEFIVDPIVLPSLADNLDRCLSQLVAGFEGVLAALESRPVAISFAFPGPADYANGVIGGYLPNFPSFRDGVALGPFLESRFNLPVYINNDGDLYAYGEALAGKLPEINSKIAKMRGTKVYKTLIGYTLGSGFGIGHVYDGVLHLGDNCCIETFCLPHKSSPDIIVEEGVAARAIKRVYAERSGVCDQSLEPKDIFNIAKGVRDGDRQAAIESFEQLGEIAANAISVAASLIDGIIVIGGGISAAKRYIMPALLKELRGSLRTISGDQVQRVQSKIYNLDDEQELLEFAKGGNRQIKVYGSDEYVTYNSEKRIGVATSSIGAAKAISLGAYNYALSQIDKGEI